METKNKIITMSDLERIKCLLRRDPCGTMSSPKMHTCKPIWLMKDYSMLAESAYYAQVVSALYEALWRMGDAAEIFWGEVDTYEPHIEILPESPYIRIGWHYQGHADDYMHEIEKRVAVCGQDKKAAAEKEYEMVKKYTKNTLAGNTMPEESLEDWLANINDWLYNIKFKHEHRGAQETPAQSDASNNE